MSKLYVWVENEKGQQKTLRGDSILTAQINYGSRDHSTLAVKVKVTWFNGMDKPKIEIDIPDSLKNCYVVYP